MKPLVSCNMTRNLIDFRKIISIINYSFAFNMAEFLVFSISICLNVCFLPQLNR